MSRRTPLYDRHVAAGGRMVDFAGWEMPVQYVGILEEHRAVRESCGMFDISHMGEFFVRGAKAGEWLDSLLTNRVAKLAVGEAQYSLMLNENGGVIDDLIVYRIGNEEYLLVVNAAKIEEDFAWMQARCSGSMELSNDSDKSAAIAVQGPGAPEIFSKVFGRELPGRNRVIEIAGGEHASRVQGSASCRTDSSGRMPENTPKMGVLPGQDGGFVITTGYTGEQGFEAVLPAREAGRYWDLFAEAGAKPCGLGARDTLRLEMCYPLNGSDLSPEHTPLEAGLGFFVDLEKPDFVGKAALERQKAEGLPFRLAALRAEEKSPPIRPHYPVLAEGAKVAETTSGALSPSLGCGIAMAYLPFALAKPGQALEIEIRGRPYRAVVVKKPFYQPKI